MTTSKIDPHAPLAVQLRRYSMPVNLQLGATTYPDTWHLLRPRDNTYHKVQPLNTTLTATGLTVKAKSESLTVPRAQIAAVTVEAEQSLLHGGVGLVPIIDAVYMARITVTTTDGTELHLSLPTFSFIPALQSQLTALHIPLHDPLNLAAHLTDSHDYLQTHFAAATK